MRYILSLLLPTALYGCSSPRIVVSTCDISSEHTTRKYGDFDVHITNSDNKENPTIWEGPICIDSPTYISPCLFNQSLIKSVNYNKTSRSLRVTTFSGSESYNWNINLEKCEISKL